MLKEVIDRILELGRPEKVDVDGLTHTTQKLFPAVPPRVARLTVRTLTGFVEFLKANKDGFLLSGAVIQVESHETVTIYSQADEDWKDREHYIAACYRSPDKAFKFDQKYAHEEFIIALQTHFEDTDDLRTLQVLVAKLTTEKSSSTEDDGISQRVAIKKGVTLKEHVPVKNPVMLKPRRTFLEIDQVLTPFIIRVHDATYENGLPMLALYEADGGAWKIEAMNRIQTYLQAELPDLTVIS